MIDPAATTVTRERLVPGVEIPTRWEKTDFDALDNAYQKIRGEINAKIANPSSTA